MVKWPNTTAKSHVRINWGDGSPIDSLSYMYSGCAMDSCVTLHYTSTHTYPANGTFTATAVDSFFIHGIVNIPNSQSQKLRLRQEITTVLWDTPPFTNFLGCLSGGVGCAATDIAYNGGEFDTDGDSISYQVVLNNDIAGYSLPPVTVANSGLVTFTSNAAPGYYNVRVKIGQWRRQSVNGPYAFIGASFRDLIFRVLCPNVSVEQQDLLNHLRVYPNPANTDVNIRYGAMGPNPVLTDLVDGFGRTIFSGLNATCIDVSLLPAGLYFIRFSSGKDHRAVRLVKE